MAIDPRRIEVIDDTSEEVFRRMTPAERVARGLSMGEFSRRIVEASVREQHPDWDHARVAREVARRFSGDRGTRAAAANSARAE